MGLVEPDVIEIGQQLRPLFDYVKNIHNGLPSSLYCDYYLFGFVKGFTIEAIYRMGERNHDEITNKYWKVLSSLYEKPSIELLRIFSFDIQNSEYNFRLGTDAARSVFANHSNGDKDYLSPIIHHLIETYALTQDRTEVE